MKKLQKLRIFRGEYAEQIAYTETLRERIRELENEVSE